MASMVCAAGFRRAAQGAGLRIPSSTRRESAPVQPNYRIEDTTGIVSPGLVVFQDLVEANIRKMIEVAQTTSDINFDDSHLARTRSLIQDIETRLEVGERLLQVEEIYFDSIPLDEELDTESNIVDQVSEYFGGDRDVEAEIDEKFAAYELN